MNYYIIILFLEICGCAVCDEVNQTTIIQKALLDRSNDKEVDDISSVIYFPTSSKHGWSNGDSCLTLYGKEGTCQSPSHCFHGHHQSFQTQLLVHCSQTNGIVLICCPTEKSNVSCNKDTLDRKQDRINQLPSPPNPIIPPKDQTNLINQNVCGTYDGNTYGQWPWMVSIGHEFSNGSYHWICVGTLISTNSILSIATCLQRNPNVVALGTSILGESNESLQIETISQIMIHETFTTPYLYKNIGLIQLSKSIKVTSHLQPICFPFLASVLDILHFKGYMTQTLAFQFPVDRSVGIKFGQIQYKVIGNDECATVVRKKDTSSQFPKGLTLDNLCTLRTKSTHLCSTPGAPLVLYDEASSSHVQIGIASGDPTCTQFNRQLLIFTRVNAFSSWVRERVLEFPVPPPCYY